jgi:hypothetical protein
MKMRDKNYMKHLEKLGMVSLQVNYADRALGIVAYCVNVYPCKNCSKLTNIYYLTPTGRPRMGCSQKCVNELYPG